MDQPHADGLWHGRDFRLYYAGRVVSVLGASVSAILLPLLAFDLTGSVALPSLIVALEALPYLVFGLVAGAWADRTDRRRLMVSIDLLAAGCLASVVVAALLGQLGVGHVIIVATVLATAFVWFDAGAFGALPALIGRAWVASANGALSVGYSVAALVGPAVAGVLVAGLGAGIAITVSALTYLFSATSLWLIRKPMSAPTASDPSRSFRAEIAAGLRFLWHQRLIRSLVIVGSAVSVVDGMLKGVLLVFAVRVLGVPSDDPAVGVVFAGVAAGSVLGGMTAIAFGRRSPGVAATIVGLVVMPVGVILLAIAPGLLVAFLGAAVFELAHTLVIVNGIAVRQTVTPDELQGRVNVTARMIAWGGTPFGAAIGAVMLGVTAPSDVLVVPAVLLVIIVAVALAGPTSLRPFLRRGASAAVAAHGG